MNENEKNYVPGPEQDYVARALLNWLNEYPDFPERVTGIESEYLSGKTSMGLFAIEAAYKTAEYISGAYEAQYQFALQYRVATSGSGARLSAVEALGAIASWAEWRSGEMDDPPEIGAGKRAASVERTSPAVMVARNADGSEDYQILMVMAYSVNP